MRERKMDRCCSAGTKAGDLAVLGLSRRYLKALRFIGFWPLLSMSGGQTNESKKMDNGL
ncbi:MAG: hypothetical protein KGZ50_08615 [Peptococcaceae bacterium]|nr:hypothetical protein [Peptococcaceae bacterium]